MSVTPSKPTVCVEWCGSTDFSLTRRAVGAGGEQIVYQCARCGRAASMPLPRGTVRRPSELPLFDESLRKRQETARSLEIAAESAANRAQWFREHDAYLRSPEWQRRRAAVMRRANGTCEGCGERPAVQVHHLTYDHWRDELLWELVAVCNPCHERAHRKDDHARP